MGSLPYRPATGPEARHHLIPSWGPQRRQLLDGISAFQRACSPRCTFLSFLKAPCDEGFLHTSLHSLPFKVHSSVSHCPLLTWGSMWWVGSLETLRHLWVSMVALQGEKELLTFPSVVTAANTVEEYGAQATSPTAEFRS